jgi:hypothetical protein
MVGRPLPLSQSGLRLASHRRILLEDGRAGILSPSPPVSRPAATVTASLTAKPERRHPGVVTPSRRTAAVGGRPAGRPPWGVGLSHFRIRVGEDLLDDVGVLNARDDPHCTATGRAALDVDPKDTLQALRPSDRGAAFRCRGLLRIRAPRSEYRLRRLQRGKARGETCGLPVGTGANPER